MLTMMIADDEPIIREGLRDCIPWQTYGIRIVGEAENGRRALAGIRELKPDILLTDILMPGMTGIELIEAIRREDHCVKVVMISAHQDLPYIKSAFKYDASDYILKPFSNDELLQTISRISQQILAERKQQDTVSHMQAMLEQAHRQLQEYEDSLVDKSEDLEQGDGRDARLIRRLLEVMESRMQEDWTLQQLADEVHLSTSHMTYLFKKLTGETVLDYLTRLRMARAAQLLADDSAKIYEIADASGYRDPNYFSRLFKKYYGYTPKEYRDRRS